MYGGLRFTGSGNTDQWQKTSQIAENLKQRIQFLKREPMLVSFNLILMSNITAAQDSKEFLKDNIYIYIRKQIIDVSFV